MKKLGIINRDISRVLGYLGHTDTITVADCGLPIPDQVECIDISLAMNVPRFIDVLKEINKDLVVEKIILADNIRTKNVGIYDALMAIYSHVEVEFVTHTQFKEMTKSSKVIIRTGEATPYANIIFQSACKF